MSIVQAELVWRKATVNDDTGANGGRMTHLAITSGVKNNIWPDVPQAERTAGSTKHRKVFVHVANDDDLTLVAPRLFVERQTPGDDRVIFFAGTQDDTASGIAGTETKYGCGILNTNYTAGGMTIAVLVEDWSVANDRIFADGRKIRISDKANIDGSGNEEYATISGAPSAAGNVITLTLAAALANSYVATTTKVSTVYEPGDVACAVSNWSESGSGTYNESGYPVLCDNIATIYQNWTITFTSATEFTLAGDVLGAGVATGNVSTNFTPINPNFSKPYFTLRSAGFGGTWTTGNTIAFRTAPAAVPLWYKRVVPAGAASLSGNSAIVAVDGESA